MDQSEFFEQLVRVSTVADVEAIMDEFITDNADFVKWIPFGRENNKGTIEASADPGRSLVERLTNGIDAILEAKYEEYNGRPLSKSPKEAGIHWLGIPIGGLSEWSPAQRRNLAQQVTIKVRSGEGKSSRLVEVRDNGIGITPEAMPQTILSLGETNKVQKHHLVGVYGQGGSSTLATSKFVFIASLHKDSAEVGFTVACYEDLPADEFKVGRYVYLVWNNTVLTTPVSAEPFPVGTLIRHFGYDLTDYSSSLGPNSLYGMLNQILFDPIVPVWLDDSEVHGYRRVIKGTRNALNGASDEGDEEAKGPTLSHKMPMFYVSLPDVGRIGIEYWLLNAPTTSNKRPSASYVNPAKPIILTLNGQNQAELQVSLIKKDAELLYLAQRLICHIDCDNLTPSAKRALFVSNRENARRGMIYDLIYDEIVRALKSDDQLTRLNAEAHEQGLREKDKDSSDRLRNEVAKLLRLQGIDAGIGSASVPGTGGADREPVTRGPRIRFTPQEIPIKEPPTYIKFLWGEDKTIDFYPGQRRYIRIETDANSSYHNPDPAHSRINVVTSIGIAFRGSTSLIGGRMRILVEASDDIVLGTTGAIHIDLNRVGLPALSDERDFLIVIPPPIQKTERSLTLPPFEPIPVSPDEDKWTQLGWPDEPASIACSASTEDGKLYIYYNIAYPKYAEQLASFERRDRVKGELFTSRYEVWLAVHSLLFYYDHLHPKSDSSRSQQENEEAFETWEREERCRIATMAALVAATEVKSSTQLADSEAD